jgi:hypothetical protein
LWWRCEALLFVLHGLEKFFPGLWIESCQRVWPTRLGHRFLGLLFDFEFLLVWIVVLVEKVPEDLQVESDGGQGITDRVILCQDRAQEITGGRDWGSPASSLPTGLLQELP